jgi:hypothetical protein
MLTDGEKRGPDSARGRALPEFHLLKATSPALRPKRASNSRIA